uniref:Tetratricopeptide repeat protein n=1 Tax=Megaviridae environmental sample TaxID=1737588 RepID=A0A5J6VHT4_9VIRU|nr:MAG: hypothetical protein [Megaviridae environmental sample]
MFVFIFIGGIILLVFSILINMKRRNLEETNYPQGEFSDTELIKTGDYLFSKKQYRGAANMYKRALEYERTTNILQKYADSLRMGGNLEESMKIYYEIARLDESTRVAEGDAPSLGKRWANLPPEVQELLDVNKDSHYDHADFTIHEDYVLPSEYMGIFNKKSPWSSRSLATTNYMYRSRDLDNITINM